MPRFSDILIDHFQDPRNLGRIENADRVGRASIAGGATLVVYLRINGGRVSEAKFEAAGCGVTIASGSILTELIEGRAVGDCLAIAPDDVAAALGGVPADKRHCPLLAVSALHDALQSLSPAS